MTTSSVQSVAWCLPRPAKSRYPGAFPLHFEKKLKEFLLLLGAPRTAKILQPFGGKAQLGLRLDLKPEVRPDIIADAHMLPFLPSTFDVVILDPPFSTHKSITLYATGPLHFKAYISEAARVLKTGGFLVMYHTHSMPGVPGLKLRARILLETRVNHLARIVHIRQKQ
jgi:SAM-dependent methyltransferase